MNPPEPPEFSRVAIIGLGLMGGSLGMALRAHRAATVVVGFDPADGVSDAAIAAGALDHAAPNIMACAAGADLVVLATPVLATRALLAEIAPALAPGALVTDMGSTKVEVMQWAAAALPGGARFVGGHPMCGNERSGIAAASAALFRGAVWCLALGPGASETTLARLSALIVRLGALPLVVDAARHDVAVARVSHLPLVAAAALVLAAADYEEWPLASLLAASGFRDTTRVASGSPQMARDICVTNATAITAALDAYIETLQSLRARLAAGDGPALLERFTAARAAREAYLDQHAPGL